MKLRNKKTGKIDNIVILTNSDGVVKYDSLAELNEEWEDYEEPKEYWCIDWTGGINRITVLDGIDNKKEIGNYFETKEEAEKVVEKLKAWKRLKDLGFRFIGKTWEYKSDKHFGSVFFETSGDILHIYDDNVEFYDDLDLLFGGKE